MFVEYDFTVFIEPCLVNMYTATLEVADISYAIGTPDLINVSPYVFDEQPVCEYPETVTLTNLPAFLSHNAPGTDDFSLPSQSDLSFIGSYVVTIRSEIQVPDDYTNSVFTTKFVEYDFTVFIEPCVVNTYSDTLKVTLIEYFIGDPTLVDGKYMFEQDPFCGYDETVTVSNVPAFAVHNDVSADFSVPTNSDLSLIGEYIITIRSEIQVPDDYTKSTFSTMFVQYDFPLRV